MGLIGHTKEQIYFNVNFNILFVPFCFCYYNQDHIRTSYFYIVIINNI